MEPTEEAEVELARKLLAEWDEGSGTSKSEIERREWDDGGAHGRRFDRFIFQQLGVRTTRRSKQTDRISDLERQVRSLGAHPVGVAPSEVERHLQHSRAACLSALRVWNDPDSPFRTGGFALFFVTAWNSLALAILHRDGGEWRKLKIGQPVIRDGVEETLDTIDLVRSAFDGAGLLENLRFWIDLRNAVAHRYLPPLDVRVIPHAQAGLVNYERIIVDEFGEEYQLAQRLSVPLQLSGFRDPEVLASRKLAQAALPLDVQALLSRAEETTPELLADETFMMRIAFIPVVPASGRNPDAVAYFMKPGEVPEELQQSIEQYVVLPKLVRGPRPSLGGQQVVDEVKKRIPFRFSTADHAAVARYLKVRPERGQADASLDELFCEYVSAAKIYVYNQRWVDRVVEQVSTPEGFRAATGREPSPIGISLPLEAES